MGGRPSRWVLISADVRSHALTLSLALRASLVLSLSLSLSLQALKRIKEIIEDPKRLLLDV